MARDIVERLRDRAYAGLPDPLLAEAADEIERLRKGAVSGCETVQCVTEPVPKETWAEVSATLTDSELEAIEAAARIVDQYEDDMDGFPSGVVATLRGLLERHGTGDTPPPHATPPQGSVQGDGSVPDSRNANEPVAWAVMYPNGEFGILAFYRREAEDRATASDRVVPLYRQPQPTLTDAEREAVEDAAIIVHQHDAVMEAPTPSARVVALRGLLERTK